MIQDTVKNISTHNGAWQVEDEIVVPRQTEESLMPVVMKHGTQTAKPVMTWRPVSNAVDSAAKAREDSIIRAVNDSLAHEKSGYGLILEVPGGAPIAQPETPHTNPYDGVSWIFAVLALLFCVVCLKIRNSPRYVATLISETKEVRTRHNMFDNTVRETSFLIILIIGWIICAGILLWQLVGLMVSGDPSYSFSVTGNTLRGTGLCVGVTAVYVIFMLIGYEITGNVFSDNKLTRAWVKVASSIMGLQLFVLFPLALLSLCYVEWNETILIIAAVVFVLGKLQFIYKGFKIFFNQISSWLLFLYYLCSLEIVPLIVTYFGALVACSSWM